MRTGAFNGFVDIDPRRGSGTRYAVGLQLKGPLDRDNILKLVQAICDKFKALAENNRPLAVAI